MDLKQDCVGKQAPHLVDGDTCHHVHNAAERFTNEFDDYLETVYVYVDFKWSPDLRDKLEELCELVGVKYTVPQRYVATRWLSVYDVAVDTLRMLDALTLFYYAFLPTSDRTHYSHVCVEIYMRKALEQEARDAIRDIQRNLRCKKSGPKKERQERSGLMPSYLSNAHTQTYYCSSIAAPCHF